MDDGRFASVLPKTRVIDEQSDKKGNVPRLISKTLWGRLNEDIRTEILVHLKHFEPPQGFADELWNELSDNLKDKILLATGKESTIKTHYSSNVLKLLFDYSVEVDFDPVINIASIVNALVLTIPFSVISTVNGQYFQSLKSTLDSCSSTGKTWDGHTYDDIFNLYTLTMSTQIFSSICGILCAAIYSTMKPFLGHKRTKWSLVKERILIFLLFVATSAAFMSLLGTMKFILNYFIVAPNDVCAANPKNVYAPGFALVGCTVFIGVYLMH